MANITVKPVVKAVTKEVVVVAAQPARVTLDISPLELALLYNAIGKTSGNNGWDIFKDMRAALKKLDIDSDSISSLDHEHPTGKQVMDELIPAIVRKAGH